MPNIREYREIIISTENFERMLNEALGGASHALTWFDYSEGYWTAEMKTQGFYEGLDRLTAESISSTGIPYSETIFDCYQEASPREVEGGSCFMDRMRHILGDDVVTDADFALEAILKSENDQQIMFLFIRAVDSDQ